MNALKIAVAGLLLAGCAGQGGMFGPGTFTVLEADTRFVEGDDLVYLSENNRISSRSIAGGIHIDGAGLYINPAVAKDATTGEVVWLALHLVNLTSTSSTFGMPNSLGLPQQIAFVIDGGSPMILDIQAEGTVWGETVNYNPVSRDASRNVMEAGVIFLDAEQYARILAAETLAVRIDGSRRAATYEAEHIAATFLPNLGEFFQSYVVSAD